MKSKLYLSLVMLLIPMILMGQGIIISSGTYIIQSDGTMTLLGNWINNGTFTPTGGTVQFGGTTQSISGTATLNPFNNLTIESGCALTIPANTNVTVAGTLTNSAGSTGLILQSTTAGSASLIHNTAGVAATTERHMNQNRWHIIAPSVTGQSIASFVTNGSNTIPVSGNNYGMMNYSESGGGWVYYTVSPAPVGNLSVGTGYLLRHTVNDSVSLAGPLNAATTNVNITKSANGWNGIGNPFPCSIGVRSDATSSDNFLTYNASQLDPSFAALYLWDEPAVRTSGVSYYNIICNAGFVSTTGRTVIDQAYMQPGQGFIVKAKTGGGTVSFTTNMRLHENTGSYFKSARVSWPGINLVVSSANKSASTAITFHQNMTRGLDVTYDTGLMGGDPAFSLYSRLVEDNGVKFMLQCLPDDGFDNMRIPIGLDCKVGGTVTFTAEIVPLPPGIKAILADSLLGKFTDLEEPSATYTTTVNPNTSGIGRFFLNISTSVTSAVSATSVNSIDYHAIDIYANGKEIIIKGKVNNNTKANLYDITGLLIRSYNLQPSDINILPDDGLPTGIFVVKVFGDGLSVNKKVFLE